MNYSAGRGRRIVQADGAVGVKVGKLESSEPISGGHGCAVWLEHVCEAGIRCHEAGEAGVRRLRGLQGSPERIRLS